MVREERERRGGGFLLCCYAGTSCEGVEGDTLAEEEIPDGAADGGAVLDGFEGVAFSDVPFYAFGVLVSLFPSFESFFGLGRGMNGLNGRER